MQSSDCYGYILRWRHLNRQFYHSPWLNRKIYQNCCRLREKEVSRSYAPINALINGNLESINLRDVQWSEFNERLPSPELICGRPIPPPPSAEIASHGFEEAYYRAVLGHLYDENSKDFATKARFPCFQREGDQQFYLKCLRRDLSAPTRANSEGLHPIVILCLLFREDGPFPVTDARKEDDLANSSLGLLENILGHYLAGSRVPLSVYRYICGLIPCSSRAAQCIWAHDRTVLNEWCHHSKHERFKRRIILECFRGIVDNLKDRGSSGSQKRPNDPKKVIDWLCTSDGSRDIAPRIISKAAIHEGLFDIQEYMVDKHRFLPNINVDGTHLENLPEGTEGGA